MLRVPHVVLWHLNLALALQSSSGPSTRLEYAFVGLSPGDAAEARAKNGSWVPCVLVGGTVGGRAFHVQVLDGAHAYALPSVPVSMLRRALNPGERDFRVDDSALNHSGFGIRYHFLKLAQAQLDEVAPWGTLVSGTDEGDGWVRVSQLAGLYLPRSIDGAAVLVPDGRDRPREILDPDEERFAPGEAVEFKDRAGQWYPAHVTGRGKQFGTYQVTVTPQENALYPMNDVAPRHLRRVFVAEAATAAEPPACRGGGCVFLLLSHHGRETALRVPKRARVEMLMKMACNRLKLDWTACLEQFRFSHGGEEVSRFARMEESGLADGDRIDMESLEAGMV